MAWRFRIYAGPPSNPEGFDATHTASIGSISAGQRPDFVRGGDPATDGQGFRVGFHHGTAVLRMDCGGSFSAGDELASDGSGRVVAAGSGDHVAARALEGSFGAGDTAWCAVW